MGREVSGPVSAADAAAAILDALRGGETAAVATVLSGEGTRPGARLLLRAGGGRVGTTGEATIDAALFERLAAAVGEGTPLARREEVREGERAWSVYVEVHRAPDELLVVGAGHIAAALVPLAATVGFRVTVLDDREGFAAPDRFPAASRLVHMDFSDPFRDVAVGAASWVLLVTRAHRYDYDCLRRLLAMEPPPRHIGMLGSRRRVRGAFAALLREGIGRERIGRVAAPLGLDIGAETPDEIAVSIAAELIELRRGGRSGARLSERERVLERLLPEERDGR